MAILSNKKRNVEALCWGIIENWTGSEMGSSCYTYCHRHRRFPWGHSAGNSSSSCLFLFVLVLSVHPQSLHCSLLKLKDSRRILEDKNGKVAFATVLSTNETFFFFFSPANLEPTCLILSWFVVPHEKGMTVHNRIQEESFILGSVMRMVQTLPGLPHRVSKVEFQNEDEWLETWLRG